MEHTIHKSDGHCHFVGHDVRSTRGDAQNPGKSNLIEVKKLLQTAHVVQAITPVKPN